MVTFIIFAICSFLAVKGIFVAQRLLNNVDKKIIQEKGQPANKNESGNETKLPSQTLLQREVDAFRQQNEALEMKSRLRLGVVVWLAVVFLIGFLLDVSLEHFKLFEDGLSFNSFFSAVVLFVLGALCIGYLVLRILLRLIGVDNLLFGRK